MSNRARTPALRRAADSNSPFPPQSRGSSSSTPNGSRKSRHHHTSSYDGGVFGVSSARDTSSSRKDQSAVTARSNLLQPRVAVVLGLSEAWHLLLFLCRLLSIVPAVCWGLPLGLRLLALLHLMFSGNLEASAGTDGTFEARLRMTETLLATIWCGASGYLSFFFTDCLMSRWLVHYTPQATLIRLVTIAITNVYLTSRALWLTGGHADPRLLLPVWIFISTVCAVSTVQHPLRLILPHLRDARDARHKHKH